MIYILDATFYFLFAIVTEHFFHAGELERLGLCGSFQADGVLLFLGAVLKFWAF